MASAGPFRVSPEAVPRLSIFRAASGHPRSSACRFWARRCFEPSNWRWSGRSSASS
jgi:hypothetical protein